MKKIHVRFMLIICCLLLVLGTSVITGCADSQQPETTATSETSEASDSDADNDETTVTTTEDIPTASLVIYTNGGTDGRAEWLTEKAAEAGFEITVMNLGGGDLANRAIAEKNNQVADVVYGLNPMEYERMKREGLMMKYEPAWSDKVDSTLADPEGYYYPIFIQPLLMAVNTDVITDSNAPGSWEELGTNPDFTGQYTILGLHGATSRSIIVGILSNHIDEDGELGISDLGWEVMTQFIQNGHITQEGEDWFGAMVSGERPITQIWGSGLLQRIDEMNLTNVDFLVPEIGAPYIVPQVAVFQNSSNPELAKAFVDWFGDTEIMAGWSNQFGTIPTNEEAAEHAADDVRDMIDRIHPQDINWNFASEMVEQWMEKIELEIVP